MASIEQVGGTHYQRGDKPQHWDVVIHCMEGRYLEGNVTKYVCRHGSKAGKEDLRKALTYLMKLLENISMFAPLAACKRSARSFEMQNEFMTSMPYEERRIFYNVVNWTDFRDLHMARDILVALIEKR